MEKRLSKVKKQAPTRRQIDAYVAARNQKFDKKIQKLKQTLTAQEIAIYGLCEEKSTLEKEIQVASDEIRVLNSKNLSFEDLKVELAKAKQLLLTSNAELKSSLGKLKYIVIEINKSEKELETLHGKFFKKQKREECESLLNSLRCQKDQIDLQKLSQTNLNQVLLQSRLELEKQVQLHSYVAWGKKRIWEIEAKIRTEEKSLTAKNEALESLSKKFKKEKSLEESLLIPRAAKFVAQQHKELQRKKLVKQSEIRKIQRDIEKLTSFLVENSLSDLEKQLHVANSAIEKLEIKSNLLQGSILRWIKNKVATNEFWNREFANSSPGQVLIKLKRENRLHGYLPLYNLDAKHQELIKLIAKKRNSAFLIEDGIEEAKQASIQLAKVKRELNALEKIEAKLPTGAKRGSLPRMAIENWSDAELFAEKYMKWLGFADAKRTGGGADEGKDVDSRKAIAQVKDMGTGASRPMLQQLNGVAAAERKIPIFFARSYATTAKEWGEKHGIALFQFTLRGEVKAISKKARALLEGK